MKNQSRLIDPALLERWQSNEKIMAQRLATLGIKRPDLMLYGPRYQADATRLADAVTPAPSAAYGHAEIILTLELCQLAGASLQQTQEFVSGKVPLASVRKILAATVALQQPDNGDRMASWREVQTQTRKEFRH